MACEILVPWSRIEPTVPRIGSTVLTTGLPGKSQIGIFIYFFLFGCAGGSLLLCGLFSSCRKSGLLLVAVQGLFIAVTFLLWSTGSRHADFSSWGSWAQEPRLINCGPWA